MTLYFLLVEKLCFILNKRTLYHKGHSSGHIYQLPFEISISLFNFIFLSFSDIFSLISVGFCVNSFWAISYILLTLLTGFLTWLFSCVLK